jgi:hypothetical protein
MKEEYTVQASGPSASETHTNITFSFPRGRNAEEAPFSLAQIKKIAQAATQFEPFLTNLLPERSRGKRNWKANPRFVAHTQPAAISLIEKQEGIKQLSDLFCPPGTFWTWQFFQNVEVDFVLQGTFADAGKLITVLETLVPFIDACLRLGGRRKLSDYNAESTGFISFLSSSKLYHPQKELVHSPKGRKMASPLRGTPAAPPIVPAVSHRSAPPTTNRSGGLAEQEQPSLGLPPLRPFKNTTSSSFTRPRSPSAVSSSYWSSFSSSSGWSSSTSSSHWP